MSLSKMDSLADEVSLVIYGYLNVKDLLVMRKVSVRHARLTMDKKMWTSISRSMELFRDERYFTGKGGSETLLANLQDISGENLAWLVCRVQAWEVQQAQCTAVFSAILTGEDLNLENITISPINLGNVDADLLAGALTRMKTVTLIANLTTSQATAFFQAILTQEERQLDNLTIHFNSLEEVDGELLAGAVTRMKTVNLNYTSLTASQTTDICHAIQAADEELELEELTMEMGNNQLSEVDRDLLAGAVVRIKTVYLGVNTPLSKAYATAILHAILGEKNLVLKKLSMWIPKNLEPDLVATVKGKVMLL